MMIPPIDAAPQLAASATPFTQPTATRFTTLLAAAILTTGRRTVANVMRTVGDLVHGHRTSYQRVLSATIGQYCGRWGIELDLRSLKRTLQMDVLRGRPRWVQVAAPDAEPADMATRAGGEVVAGE